MWNSSPPGFVLFLVLATWLAADGRPLRGQVPGNVMARVVNSYTGEPIAGVQVVVVGTAVGSRTNDDGMGQLSEIPPGPRTVRAILIGYETADVSVNVPSGDTTVVEIELDPPLLSAVPEINAGTALDSLRTVFQDSLELLPAADGEDRILIPRWFRAYYRHLDPELPTSGPYQYPHVLAGLYNRLLTHQNLVYTPPDTVTGEDPELQRSISHMMGAGRLSGTNINLSNRREVHRETSVTIDPREPRFVLAAANNPDAVPGGLIAFRSSDGGRCWNSTPLPLHYEGPFHSDPSVAWDPGGTGWIATLEVARSAGLHPQVQLFRSQDRGATWEYVATVSDGGGNDKPMLAVGPGSGGSGPSIHVAWGDLHNEGILFRRSADGGESWEDIKEISSDLGFGANIAIGSGGEVYVAWRDLVSDGMKVWRMSDGNVSEVAPLNTSLLRIRVPSACWQPPMTYPAVGVDSTAGGGPELVYVSWMDLNSNSVGEPGCDVTASTGYTDIFVSHRDYGAGSAGAWSTPRPVGYADRDQFQPWMAVDPRDGAVHVSFYSSEPGRRKSIRLHHVVSSDGGGSWSAIPIASEASTHPDANAREQWGDYSGISVVEGLAIPAWTDRRADMSHGLTQAFSAIVEGGAVTDPVCPAAQITFAPSPIRLRRGEETSVDVRITRNGAPVAGDWIGFEASGPEIAELSHRSRRTDATGTATLTITGGIEGAAVVSAGALGAVEELSVQVEQMEDVCPWWIWVVLAVGVILLLLGLFLLVVTMGSSWWAWLLSFLGAAVLALAVYRLLAC